MAAIFSGYAGVVIVFLLEDGSTVVAEVHSPQKVGIHRDVPEIWETPISQRINLAVHLDDARSVTMTQHRADCPWPDDCSCAG